MSDLDDVVAQLLEQWHSRGDEPLTVRQVTELLATLGRAEANERNGWQLVRAWLLAWPEVARVGQDYWVPVVAVPQAPGRTRLQVLPVRGAASAEEERNEEGSIPQRPEAPEQEIHPRLDNSPVPQSREAMANRVSWTFLLRTIHLLEGFLQALKALRGGAGESYRQSLQTVLSEKPEGLSFVHVVQALRERQGHDVARNTVRAILYAGGFLHRDRRWFAAPQSGYGGRKLRAALVETFVSTEEPEQTPIPVIEAVRQYRKLKAIRARLAELMLALQKS